MAENATKRQPNLVVVQVVDNEGKILTGLTSKNINIVKITKKLDVDLFNEINKTEGAFIIQV